MDVNDPISIAADWQFVPADDGYIFYPAGDARGIRVTAEERELFVRGTIEEWYARLQGREATEPAMSYWAGLRHRLATMPVWLHSLIAISGVSMLENGYSGLAQGTMDRTPAVILLLGGGIGSIFGLLGAWLSWVRSRRNVR